MSRRLLIRRVTESMMMRRHACKSQLKVWFWMWRLVLWKLGQKCTHLPTLSRAATRCNTEIRFMLSVLEAPQLNNKPSVRPWAVVAKKMNLRCLEALAKSSSSQLRVTNIASRCIATAFWNPNGPKLMTAFSADRDVKVTLMSELMEVEQKTGSDFREILGKPFKKATYFFTLNYKPPL